MAVDPGRVVWATSALALAFVLNQALEPRFVRKYDQAEYSTATGRARIARDEAAPESLPLMTMHAVIAEVARFGRTYEVRELWIRSTVLRSEPPRLEIFAQLPAGFGPSQVQEAPRWLQQRELEIVPRGFLGTRPSYLELAGQGFAQVVKGVLSFSVLTPVAQGGFDAQGRLELQVQGESGIRSVSGRVQGRLVLDPPSAGAARK